MALQFKSCMTEGVDIRALFERVMAKYEQGGNRCGLALSNESGCYTSNIAHIECILRPANKHT